MQPAPEKRPEVVYRRTPEGGPGANRAKSLETGWRGIAPATIPLVVGFVLLLGLISTLGILTLQLLNDMNFRARDMGTQRAGRIKLLWDLRAGVTKLDSEARSRARLGADRGLAPPFELRMDAARA